MERQYFTVVYSIALKSGRTWFGKLISPSVSYIRKRSTIIVPPHSVVEKIKQVFTGKAFGIL